MLKINKYIYIYIILKKQIRVNSVSFDKPTTQMRIKKNQKKHLANKTKLKKTFKKL